MSELGVDCQMGLSFTLALSLEIRISSWPVIDTCLSLSRCFDMVCRADKQVGSSPISMYSSRALQRSTWSSRASGEPRPCQVYQDRLGTKPIFHQDGLGTNMFGKS